MHVESCQICPNGRGVNLITLKDTIKIENFCRYDVFQVTESGIRSSLVKPAGKREVVVSMKGIHPNTRDNVVLDYLAKFGRIVTTKVVHGMFNDGPLKGLKNGDRSYKMEIKPGENIGSYHVIDGQKISLRYAGQQQTCGRCHETPQKCKGRGIARKCEAEGGIKIEFSDYILALWHRIGYSPPSGDFARDIIEDIGPNTEQVGGSFTPLKVYSGDVDKYAGVSIRQFPRDTDQGEIVEFLCKEGLPEDKKDDISFQAKGVVAISNLDNVTSRLLIETIHGKQHFGRKLYCNGYIPISPEKIDETPAETTSEKPDPTISTLAPSLPAPQSSVTAPVKIIHPNDSQFKSPHLHNFEQTSTSALVRRHSLCLENRLPPSNSLAAELLSEPDYTARPGLLRTQSMLKEIADQLSDFGSCRSELSSCSSDDSVVNNSGNEGFKTMNERKRNKKFKRKLKLTPGKDQFLKKPNLVNSN